METFYKPVFKNLWPSIRISLLTTSKYCALLNNYNSESDKVENYLKDFGAYNAMEEAASARKKYLEKENKQILIENSSLPLDSFLDFPKRPQKKDENDEYNNESFDETEEEAVEKIEPVVGKNTSLHDFIPTKKVFSEKELLQQQIVSTSTFSDSMVDVPIKVIQEQVPELPNSMKFFVYPKGDVSNFPNPKMKHGDLLGQSKNLWYNNVSSFILNILHIDCTFRIACKYWYFILQNKTTSVNLVRISCFDMLTYLLRPFTPFGAWTANKLSP